MKSGKFIGGREILAVFVFMVGSWRAPSKLFECRNRSL